MLSNNAIFRRAVSRGRDVYSSGKNGIFRNFTVFFPVFTIISISLCSLNLSKNLVFVIMELYSVVSGFPV